MRRFLFTSLAALGFVIIATGSYTVAHAADTQTSYGVLAPSQGNTQSANYVTPGATGTVDPSSVYSSSIIPTGTAGATGAPSDQQLGKATSSVLSDITTWIMSLFAWLVGVAAITLDNAVYYTVVTMGNYVSKITAIGVAWRILRDVANIMLIFGFLAIGITTILNVDWYGGAKKLLPRLVIAAIAINFSLFICEAMIDGTNLIATQFYQQINNGQPAQPIGYSANFGWFGSVGNKQVTNEPISNAIMGQLGLQTIYNPANPKALIGDHVLVIGFMGSLLFVVTAFVLFSLAFILIARFVALVFFILLSPVGFMGWAVPLMQGRADQWWKNFLEQIITAPVLMILLYVALTIITDTNFLTGFNASSDGFLGLVNNANIVGFAGILLSFLVAIGFLLMVVIKAKSMSAFGASLATKTAGKLTFGATALGLRTTAGWGFQSASRAVRSKYGSTKTGRILAAGLDKGATATYDIRGTGALKNFPGGGIDAGAPAKGGYRGRQERAIKAHETYANSLEGRGATKGYGAAQEAHKAATEEVEARKAEIAKLEEMEKNETGGGAFKTSPELQQKLVAARQNLSASEAGLVTAGAKLAKEAPVSKKEVKEAYAENIKKSPLRSWVLFGPGGSVAAEKIKKAKSQGEQFDDMLKKAAKAEAEKMAKEAPAAPTHPPEKD